MVIEVAAVVTEVVVAVAAVVAALVVVLMVVLVLVMVVLPLVVAQYLAQLCWYTSTSKATTPPESLCSPPALVSEENTHRSVS